MLPPLFTPQGHGGIKAEAELRVLSSHHEQNHMPNLAAGVKSTFNKCQVWGPGLFPSLSPGSADSPVEGVG